MFNTNGECLERSSGQLPLQRLQGQPEAEGVPVKGEVKDLVKEPNRTNDVLNVIIARTDGHEFCKEDEVIH